MFTLRCLPPSAALACLVASAPAVAEYSLEAESIKLYGGSYSTDCGNSAAPRLQVAKTLNVEKGNNRMTGEKLMASASYLDPNPPANYQMALLSEVRGGAQLIFVVYRDKAGLYVELMGDPKVETALTAVLGRAQFKAKYRDCDAASRAPLPKPAAAPAPAANPDSVENWDYIRDRKFKAIHRKAIGAKAREPWISDLDGPAPPPRLVSVAGTDYRLLSVCKPHDCGDNKMIVLYSPANKTVYGKIHERGKITLIGKPPLEVAAELERLSNTEWQQGY
jgi:hypothetical protein